MSGERVISEFMARLMSCLVDQRRRVRGVDFTNYDIASPCWAIISASAAFSTEQDLTASSFQPIFVSLILA